MVVASAPAREPAPSAARRRQLVEATIACIHQRGLAGTTLAAVARRAGLAPSLASFHFKSKGALLIATLETVVAEFTACWREAIAAAGEDPADRLAALVEASLDARLSAPARVAVWDAFWGEATARVDYLRVCGDAEAAYRDAVLAACRDLAAAGAYALAEGDALGEAVMRVLYALPDDLAGGTLSPEAARRVAYALLAALFPAHFTSDGRLRRRAEPVAAGTTLAPWLYGDDEVVGLEIDRLFRPAWLLVTHESVLARPGAYATIEAMGERIAVVRGADGALRAFHNVCRHRAGRLLAGDAGCVPGKAIVCPYHGWTYRLDGRLAAVPDEAGFPGLEKARLGLAEVAVAVWQGLVFVRLRGGGPALAEVMAPVDAEAAHYRIADMAVYEPPWQEVVEVNWKTLVDNDAEGYHVPTGHPGLRRLFGKSYRDQALPHGLSRSDAVVVGRRSAIWSEGLYQALLPAAAHLPERLRRRWVYYGLFPNLSLGLYPDLVEFYQMFPIDSRRALVRGGAFALGDGREWRAVRWLNRRINREVWREDKALVEAVDAGLGSSSYRGGLIGARESLLGAFHEGVRAALPVARLASPPPLGQVAAVNARMS